MKLKMCLAASLLALNAGSVGVAQEAGRLEDPSWIKEVASPRIVYAPPGMERIRAQKEITYKRVPGGELKMDVYRPRGLPRGSRRPAVVFIHGGALPPNLRTKPKEWGAYVSFGQLAAASGFVGVTFNQRFYGWDMKSLSDARGDVADALAYLRRNSDALGIDKERICLWSLSAGSALLGPAVRGEFPFVRCMVFYYPVMDLEPLRAERPAITEEVAREFSLTSVIERVDGTPVPPLFVARAGRDEPGMNAAVDKFILAALSKKVTLDFSNHAEGQHGFDVLDDNERTREVIRSTVEFVRAHSQASPGRTVSDLKARRPPSILAARSTTPARPPSSR